MMELLKKWLDGSINWKEEKQLRNQAKEDEFLADALEGLDTLPELNHTHNINALERKLQERLDKNNKTVAYPLRAIAAAAILLLSTGIWWNIQSNLYQTPVAETEVLPAPTSPMNSVMERDVPTSSAPTPQTITKKRTETKDNIDPNQKILPVKEFAAKQKELSTTILPNDQKALINDPPQETIAATPSASTITMDAVSSEKRQNIESVTEASTLVMETIEAIPIKDESNTEEVADGITFTYVEEEVAASPTPEAMIEEPSQMATAPSDEGVISAVAEPERNTSRAMKRKLSNTPKVFPVGGLEAFEEYIKANRKYPASAKANNIRGAVYLVFTLEADGSIKHVEITKKLCPACDAEAIRLLKEGPKWISIAGIGYCEISFGMEE